MSLLGLHQPGTTWLHRLAVGPKLAGLAVAAVVVTVARGPGSGLAALAVAVGLAAWGRTGVRSTARALRGVLLVAVVLGAFQWWQLGAARAVEVVADLLALVLAATVVTATTPTDAMIDAVVRGCGPLRRFGVKPEVVGLAVSLMLGALPRLLQVAAETRDAARARGLERSPRARLVPLALRTVAHARATGDALAARGLGDDHPLDPR